MATTLTPVGPKAEQAADIVKTNVAAAIAAALLMVPLAKAAGPETAASMLTSLTEAAAEETISDLRAAGVLQDV